jgi:hypothetical protein
MENCQAPSATATPQSCQGHRDNENDSTINDQTTGNVSNMYMSRSNVIKDKGSNIGGAGQVINVWRLRFVN